MVKSLGTSGDVFEKLVGLSLPNFHSSKTIFKKVSVPNLISSFLTDFKRNNILPNETNDLWCSSDQIVVTVIICYCTVLQVLVASAKGVMTVDPKQVPNLSSGVYIMSNKSGIVKVDNDNTLNTLQKSVRSLN